MEKVENNKLLEQSPFYAILGFSVFFIIGDLFQQLYNAVDSIIVGQFVSKEALASIGVATPIMNLVMYMISGFAIGSGIVFSRWFGKGDFLMLKKSMSTALIIGLIFSILMSIFSIIFCKPFLKLINTPDEIIRDTSVYLYIIFGANVFTFLYNFYCYAIRSIGNSFIPLVFLIISTIVNAILDLLFVIAFKWGIEGAAIATLIAQFLSVVMIVIFTNKKVDLLKIKIKDIVFDKSLAKEIISYSSTVSLQQSFVYIGRISVQGLVNTYGTNAIAGVNIAEKLNALFQIPYKGYSNAATTYFAQNMGAERFDRVKKGYTATSIVTIINSIVFIAIGLIFLEPLVKLFVKANETEAISVGIDYTKAMIYGYLLSTIIFQNQSFLRGTGMLKSFFSTTLCAITLRIIFAYSLNGIWGLNSVFYAVPLSWVGGSLLSSILSFIGYVKYIKPKMHMKKQNLSL